MCPKPREASGNTPIHSDSGAQNILGSVLLTRAVVSLADA